MTTRPGGDLIFEGSSHTTTLSFASPNGSDNIIGSNTMDSPGGNSNFDAIPAASYSSWDMPWPPPAVIKTGGGMLPSSTTTVTQESSGHSSLISSPSSVKSGLYINTTRKTISVMQTPKLLEALRIFDVTDSEAGPADDEALELDFKGYWASTACLGKRATPLDRDVDEAQADAGEDLIGSLMKRSRSADLSSISRLQE